MDAMIPARAQIPNVLQWCRDKGVNRSTFYRHQQRIRAEDVCLRHHRWAAETGQVDPWPGTRKSSRQINSTAS